MGYYNYPGQLTWGTSGPPPYTGAEFVAVGSSGSAQEFIWSNDGITWTGVSSPANTTWLAVTFSSSLQIWAAVGSSNNVAWSTDGKTWNAGTGPTTSQTWCSVCWSPDLAIFVSTSTTSAAGMSSTDGKTWTNRTLWTGSGNTSSPSTNPLAWSKSVGKFASAFSSTSGDGGYSSNGTSWSTSTSLPSLLGSSGGLAWSISLGLYAGIAGGPAGSTQIVTSTNGTSWTGRGALSNGDRAYSMAWSPGLGYFVCTLRGANSGNSYTYSSTGTSWAYATGPGTNIYSVVWSVNKSIFASVGPSTIYTSSNVTTWTSRTDPVGNTWYGIGSASDGTT